MSEKIKFTVIGAGVIGCAIAHQLSGKYDDIFVIEKNSKVSGENQSSRNSGVIHAGVYYPKDLGPLRSALCVRGNDQLYTFCEAHDVPARKVGKIIVAVEDKEIPFLEETYRIALENNVPGVRYITKTQAGHKEPNVRCIKALLVPTSGIVEATCLVRELYRLSIQRGASFLFSTEVINISPSNGCFEVTTHSQGRQESFETEVLINAAGLYSDRIAKMVNPDFPHAIVPLRGESAKFYKHKRPAVTHQGMNIYPVPHAVYPDGEKADITYENYKMLLNAGEVLKTVGVHLTPTFDIKDNRYELSNTVTIGPAYNKEKQSREDYSSGLISEEYYLSRIKDYFPGIRLGDISLHQAGIQARLKDKYDWVIERDTKHPNCIHLVGIDSPGLTSCLAIARHVEEIVSRG